MPVEMPAVNARCFLTLQAGPVGPGSSSLGHATAGAQALISIPNNNPTQSLRNIGSLLLKNLETYSALETKGPSSHDKGLSGNWLVGIRAQRFHPLSARSAENAMQAGDLAR